LLLFGRCAIDFCAALLADPAYIFLLLALFGLKFLDGA
jgi:hypothetical protein